MTILRSVDLVRVLYSEYSIDGGGRWWYIPLLAKVKDIEVGQCL
jgi:hypothetical protein